jgi:archaellum component FlaC
MGKLLRVLVVIILILGGLALALAIMLFGRRELLIGRTWTLEEQVIRIAKTLEAQDPADQPQPAGLPGRDISPVTSRELDNPELSTFWDSYLHKLEQDNLPTLDIGTMDKRMQLRNYYRYENGPDGKPRKAINPLSGKPFIDGPGTMAELLDQVFARAKAQNALLNRVRAELKKVRGELADTITELNAVKKQGRTDKKMIDSLRADVARLEDEKRALERKVERLEQEKKELTAELAEAKAEIAKLKEEIENLKKTVTQMDKEIKRLLGIINKPVIGADGQPVPGNVIAKLSPGDKGKILSADSKLKFVVLELSDAFMVEMLGPDRDQPLPQIEMMVRRPGMQSASGEFVSRIRLKQVLRNKNLVIADTLIDWEQVPLEKGDVVFF